nr:beta,beta-carotene 15,15'-dioxygenase-like [Parasteatoda tepidariorum]
MEGKPASLYIPFLRSCTEESSSPIEGEIKGEIPKWLKGSLLRNGSGLLKIGPDQYNHLFDGMALVHRFGVQDGKATYQNKFVRSNAYQINMKANRIVAHEFGTLGVPDPCKTIFQRFASLFKTTELTDNDLVNVIMYANEPYACSESNAIWKIDPVTLESLERVNLSNYLPVNAAVAHAHEGTDGTVYNVGSVFSMHSKYRILKFPPKEKESDNTFEKASVVCTIPASKNLSLSYHHSFGMSENYFIFVEQPLQLSVPKLAGSAFITKSTTFADALSWNESEPCRFHVVRRSDGKLLDTVYLSKGFFVFHHINAYEEDDHLVVDLCVFDDGKIVNELYIKALEDFFKNNPHCPNGILNSRTKRFVLPLKVEGKIKDENLVKLPNTTATAKQSEDGSIFCTDELLTDEWFTELPRINYEKYNGKKYKYYYAIASNGKTSENFLIKGDVENKTSISWFEKGTIPSEPVFISDPNSENADEDSGVLLASLTYEDDENKVSLLVLDAKTMKEIGRATFLAKSSVPGTFHGIFVDKV